ncbi:MAG: tyrosine-type recombinase/integrase [Pleurocapsa minor HA4230-MV1]|jgi:integrase/recombinase XerD|nr:tyrosine-type recombinase/integrase [Pleurocapsa minor HA4230-MV1]
MKNHGKGQAAIWTPQIIRQMRSRFKSPTQRLIFEISLFTGERMGAIVQLKASDVYDKNGQVLEFITFASSTRKSTKHGAAATRQVAVHPDLKFYLETYTPQGVGYLFKSDSEIGHISLRAVDKYWRAIFDELGLSGYSTHSSRRWVINSLRKSGIEIVTIAETMGMNIQTVRHYLDNDPRECKRAIATLTI